MVLGGDASERCWVRVGGRGLGEEAGEDGKHGSSGNVGGGVHTLLVLEHTTIAPSILLCTSTDST